MLLAFYPIDWERNCFDAMTDTEIAGIIKTAINRGQDVRVYNISTQSRQTRLENVDDMCTDFNDQEIDLENYWSIAINISEEDYGQVKTLTDEEWENLDYCFHEGE